MIKLLFFKYMHFGIIEKDHTILSTLYSNYKIIYFYLFLQIVYVIIYLILV